MKINSGERPSECMKSLNDCHSEEGDSPPRDRTKFVKWHCSSGDSNILFVAQALSCLGGNVKAQNLGRLHLPLHHFA